MKISSAFIFSDNAESAQVPIPVDPVNVPMTISSIRYDYYMYKYENVDWGVTYPAYGENIVSWSNGAVQAEDGSGEYYSEHGYNTIPCNIGGSSGSSTWKTFYCNSEGFWNGRHTVYDYMQYWGPTASITVDVRGLLPGEYVFKLIHWFGYQDTNLNNKNVRVDGIKGIVIKTGTHGIIEGQAYSDIVLYTGNGDLAKGKVAKAEIMYAFTVASGDTEKVFEFGRNKEISFEDLLECIHLDEGGSSVWANCSTSFNAKVYTSYATPVPTT